jgi:ATP-dependent Clp protease ATP-binding subunit ClpA
MEHKSVGTIHLLLGIAREGKNIAAEILSGFKLSSDILLEKISTLHPTQNTESGAGHGMFQKMEGRAQRFSESALQLLKSSRKSANELNHEELEPEHLLLGILSQKDSKAYQLLMEAGIDHDILRDKLGTLLDIVELNTILSKASRNMMTILADTFAMQNTFSLDKIEPEHLLLAMCKKRHTHVSNLLAELGLTVDKLEKLLGHEGQEEPGA